MFGIAPEPLVRLTIDKGISAAMRTLHWLRWLSVLPLSLPGIMLWLWVRWRDGAQHARWHGVNGLPVASAHGPVARACLMRYPFLRVEALCVGWVILAVDEATLQRCWQHELVHVQQALRWSLLFPLLYLGSSAWAWMRGRDAYRDNVFEQEAFATEPTQHTGRNTPK